VFNITAKWQRGVFLDQGRLWRHLEAQQGGQKERLSHLLSACGVDFFDEDGLYAMAPRVLIRSIGGMPVRISESGDACVAGVPVGEAIHQMRSNMGFAGMDSYLNPKGRGALEMLAQTEELHGIPSTAHTAHLGFFVAGLSTKAELEMNCQRDIVHLSRLTSARTEAQDNPPFLVEDASMLDFYKGLRELVHSHAPLPKMPRKSDREIRNSAWPLAKCSMLGITGSVKNILKLATISNDEGKEAEVREICREIGRQTSDLFGLAM
jgi:hypothetical protein